MALVRELNAVKQTVVADAKTVYQEDRQSSTAVAVLHTTFTSKCAEVDGMSMPWVSFNAERNWYVKNSEEDNLKGDID